jgi:FkbM family methyltransferase
MPTRRSTNRITRDVWLRRLGVERSYRPPALLRHPEWNYDDILKLVVAAALRVRPDFTFLQVGAFDGRTEDPIHPLVREFGIRGIVIEPQAQLRTTIAANYAAYPQVVVVNAAIADVAGTRDFYATRGPTRKASFFRAHLLRHGVAAGDIVTQRVECVTIADVLRQHGFAQCDFIQIDAEGYDYQIVKTLDFQAVQPLIIRFEQSHMRPRDCDECLGLLRARDYRFLSQRRDVIAVRDF